MVVDMHRSLLPLVVLSLVVAFCPAAPASTRANISAGALARAINAADAGSVPYRKAKISPYDIRAIRCVGPNEEATEIQCTWWQRSRHGWVKRKTWLAIDSHGWHVID